MPLYNLYAGLGGGFGGAVFQETIECDSLDTASAYAHELSVQEYENFEGMHVLFTREEALEEDPDLTDEELDEMENEDRESWIESWAVLTSEDGEQE
jgi:hypothetical protein